ncbi:glycerol-3-phosphate 1-O-acyltransferase PlsY [Sphingomonas flavalba]|uniref:glycerol-3-phosphate 1-O-acyltransferase PlsY n=1 Tax=Sphingomonas flavalba TaxID=2559804 RepID=UPI001EEF8BE8|nr:glycerol-3-phosphate 1-O-acyltransferase PlsY [Sphingomonas flavalba]
MLWMGPAAALALGYVLGAIPFGLLLGRMAGIGDIREAGSGNIGATNVLRVGGKKLAAATLLLDAGKGAAAVLLGGLILPESGALLGGTGAFFGHLYPVWLGFRGGKGVATLLGVALALYWPVGSVFALVWVGALALFRYSSVGGMAAAVSAPLVAAICGRFELALLLIALALMVLWRHRANIERLLAGTEPRIGGAKGG